MIAGRRDGGGGRRRVVGQVGVDRRGEIVVGGGVRGVGRVKEVGWVGVAGLLFYIGICRAVGQLCREAREAITFITFGRHVWNERGNHG